MAAEPNCAVGIGVRVGGRARVIGVIDVIDGLGAGGPLQRMVGNELVNRRAQPQPIFEAFVSAYAIFPTFANPNSNPNLTTTLAMPNIQESVAGLSASCASRASCGVERRRARAGWGRAEVVENEKWFCE